MQKKIITQKKRYQPSDWQVLYEQVLQTEFDIKSGATTEEMGLTLLTQKFINNF